MREAGRDKKICLTPGYLGELIRLNKKSLVKKQT